MNLSPLGVVMPVHNERTWVRRSLSALHEAAQVAHWDLDVLVVDDGSTDGTGDVLDELAAEGLARVVHQENRGRFEARRAGLAALDTEQVLLLDARVLIDRDALRYVRTQQEADRTARVWNAHVHVISDDNLYGSFWSGLTKIGWRAYFARPRHVRYGLEEFHRYPKGTGMFLGPRKLLLSAAADFDSLFQDIRLASDDTRMIREVARQEDIHLAPEFSCRYHGRDSFEKWFKQSFFRGTTFVDGYLGDRRKASYALLATALALPLGLVALVRRPWWVLSGFVGGSLTAVAAAGRFGATARESLAVGALLGPFTAAFGTGFVRGLLLARRAPLQ